MRRAVIVAALGILVMAVVAADAATPGFRYGVAAGEVTSTSALLWTKAPAAGNVRVELGLGARVVSTRDVRASPTNAWRCRSESPACPRVRVTGFASARLPAR